MAGATRRVKGAGWSATHTIVWYGPAGERLAGTDSSRAVRVQVRWCYQGKEGKETFRGPTCHTRARRLGALLTAAREHDWPADDRRRPVPHASDVPASPAPVPTMLEHPALRLMVPRPVATGPAPAARRAAAPTDVESLATWYRERLETGLKKKGGQRRSQKTLGGYLNTLDFIVEHLRYAPGDPRLATCGRDPGDSMALHPEHGLCAPDLLVLLDRRRATDLRTRAANERRVAKWQGAVAKDGRRAAREQRTPVLPPVPSLQREEASARMSGVPAGLGEPGPRPGDEPLPVRELLEEPVELPGGRGRGTAVRTADRGDSHGSGLVWSASVLLDHVGGADISVVDFDGFFRLPR